MYKNNIIQLLVRTAIGVVVAFIMITMLESDWSFTARASMAFVYSTVPYGWSTINKYLGNWFVTGSVAAVLFSFIVKILLALLVGWILTPITLIYNLVKMLNDNK